MSNITKTIMAILLSIIMSGLFVSCAGHRHHSGDRHDSKCGPEKVWVDGHYGPKGKWIRGHCAPR